jgi:DNA repair exonuclease SbcCD ATPase subunit
VDDASFDWEFAQKEFAEAQGKNVLLEDSAAMQLIEEERKKQQAELDAQRRQLEELQQKMSSGGATEELARKNKELEEALRKQEQIAAELSQRRAREQRERSLLEDGLLKAIPMVNEANQLAEELGKDVRFEIKLLAIIHKVADMSLPEELRYQKSTEVRIRVSNGQLWSLDQFFNRVYLMREVYQNYLEAVENVIEYHCSAEEDPFFDPVDYQQIGTAMVYLSSLAHLIETELSTPILDYKGKQEGELMVDIRPTNMNEDDDFVEDARELIGNKLTFAIKLPYARGLPATVCTNAFVRYKFFLEDTPYESEKSKKKTINPTFDYSREFTINPVTEEFVKYLETEAIQFEVCATADESSKVTGGIHYVPPASDGSGGSPNSPAADGGAASQSGANASSGSNAAVVAGAAAGGAVAGAVVVAAASSSESSAGNSSSSSNLARELEKLKAELQQTKQESERKQKELQDALKQKDEEIKRLEAENKKKSKTCCMM